MSAEILIDTNILVYAYDVGEPVKQARALAALRRLVRGGRGRLSTQVLGEFFRVATTRLRPALGAAEATTQLGFLARAWVVLPVTPMIVLEAARGARDHGLAYWDAQVWATARLNQIDTVLSEDFADGRVIDGVRFVDPLRPAFEPTALA